MVRTYDSKCFDLAGVFLSDVKNIDDKRREVLKDMLAKDIQEIIEDFFMMEGLES